MNIYIGTFHLVYVFKFNFIYVFSIPEDIVLKDIKTIRFKTNQAQITAHPLFTANVMNKTLAAFFFRGSFTVATFLSGTERASGYCTALLLRPFSLQRKAYNPNE